MAASKRFTYHEIFLVGKFTVFRILYLHMQYVVTNGLNLIVKIFVSKDKNNDFEGSYFYGIQLLTINILRVFKVQMLLTLLSFRFFSLNFLIALLHSHQRICYFFILISAFVNNCFVFGKKFLVFSSFLPFTMNNGITDFSINLIDDDWCSCDVVMSGNSFAECKNGRTDIKLLITCVGNLKRWVSNHKMQMPG